MRNIVISFIIVITAMLYVYAMYDIELNMVAIPIFLCGLLSLSQVLKNSQEDFLRNEYFFLYLFLFISTFLAPLIHYKSGFWVSYFPDYPKYWSDWSIYISLIYLVGILIINFIISISKKRNFKFKRTWQFKKEAKSIVITLMIVSFIMQTLFYIKIGGVSALFNNFMTEDGIDLTGYGAYFILSEFFPFLLILLYFITHKDKKNVSRLNVFVFLIILFICCIYFGGLRGSRSNTIYTILQAVIIINFSIRKIKKKIMITLISCLMFFMFVGQMYKIYGANMFNRDNMVKTDSEKSTNSFEDIIVGDFSRYGIMSYQLYKFDQGHYDYKYGLTYLGAILTYVPGGEYISEYFGGIPTKSSSAEELFYRENNSLLTPTQKNSRIFGIVGEWFFNFGILTSFIAFIILGKIVVFMKRLTDEIDVNDARFYIMPLAVILIPLILNSDLDNVLLVFVKRIIPQFLLLLMITKRQTIKIR